MNRYSLVVTGCVFGLLGCTASASVTPNSPSDGCAQDSSVVGCESPSTGYSCGNGESPDQSDSSLVCSDPTAGDNGLTLYCCIQFTSTTCSADSSVTGCTGDSFGFSCTGTDTPDEGDSSLTCSMPTPGANGLSLYCCTD
jgi:hypothetical protein